MNLLWKSTNWFFHQKALIFLLCLRVSLIFFTITSFLFYNSKFDCTKSRQCRFCNNNRGGNWLAKIQVSEIIHFFRKCKFWNLFSKLILAFRPQFVKITFTNYHFDNLNTLLHIKQNFICSTKSIFSYASFHVLQDTFLSIILLTILLNLLSSL